MKFHINIEPLIERLKKVNRRTWLIIGGAVLLIFIIFLKMKASKVESSADLLLIQCKHDPVPVEHRQRGRRPRCRRAVYSQRQGDIADSECRQRDGRGGC